MKRIKFIRDIALKAGADYNTELYERAVNLLAEAWRLHLARKNNRLTSELIKQAANDFEFV